LDQVIAMEILYGTTMAAIFVLCLVLLWTARRILQSSPLTSGELSLTHADKVSDRDELGDAPNYAEIAQFDLEPAVAEISPSLIDPVALEIMAAEERGVEPTQASIAPPDLPQTEVLLAEVAESPKAPEQPAAKDAARTAQHPPHGYNYLLEGLLLGVSVFVLVRTQRSSWRHHRSLQSSDQVA
jgi:hypothetical protein